MTRKPVARTVPHGSPAERPDAVAPTYPPRPVPADRIDYSALRKGVMRRFPKIRAHLGE